MLSFHDHDRSLILNSQVEWLLLWARDWEDYALSPQRQQRFAVLVEMCHNYTIRAGADAAIALQQQVLRLEFVFEVPRFKNHPTARISTDQYVDLGGTRAREY